MNPRANRWAGNKTLGLTEFKIQEKSFIKYYSEIKIVLIPDFKSVAHYFSLFIYLFEDYLKHVNIYNIYICRYCLLRHIEKGYSTLVRIGTNFLRIIHEKFFAL